MLPLPPSTGPLTLEQLTERIAAVERVLYDSVEQASGLTSATTVVDTAAATAPTAGQVLTATGASAAVWQTVPPAQRVLVSSGIYGLPPPGWSDVPGLTVAVTAGQAMVFQAVVWEWVQTVIMATTYGMVACNGPATGDALYTTTQQTVWAAQDVANTPQVLTYQGALPGPWDPVFVPGAPVGAPVNAGWVPHYLCGYAAFSSSGTFAVRYHSGGGLIPWPWVRQGSYLQYTLW